VPVYANGAANQDTRESAAARPEPLRSFAGDDDDGGGFSTGRIAAIVVGAIVTIGVVAVLALTLTGGDDTPTKPNGFGETPAAQTDAGATGTDGGTTTSAAKPRSSTALTSAERRATNIAVLNGTTRTGLARSVGDKIGEDDFKIGKVDTNPDQSVPATVISYTTGHKPAALAVAKIIGVDSGSVQLADANATVLAADADVIVIVGADLVEP
jgi:hypothetical protein